MSNEHWDMAAIPAADLGFDVPMAAAVIDERSDDTLFAQITNNAFYGRPELERAGARVWLMGHALGCRMPRLERVESRNLRKWARLDALECGLMIGGVPFEMRLATMEMIVLRETTLWRIGRRASLVAYALNRGVIIRDALESFEVIGGLWGLSAENKRSAVCAAMNVLRDELIKHGSLPRDFRFWFEKELDARIVYAAAQMGNRNRAAHAEDTETLKRGDCESLGVPVREGWRELSSTERKRRLDALWRAHAWTPGGEEHEEMFERNEKES